ncbi:MAG: hypothetical protein DMG32_22500 [Acidobacteria bacterium]|nr:MAG: hypothetical protein DMG32_22500 [Acidobacteriota bacterium]
MFSLAVLYGASQFRLLLTVSSTLPFRPDTRSLCLVCRPTPNRIRLLGLRSALRFASRTAAIYARHGITNVGYWIPQQSDPELGISGENTFIYMRGYPSREERDKRLKAAHDDPEFGEVVTKQEQNPATKLIIKAHNIDMVPNGTYTAITIIR